MAVDPKANSADVKQLTADMAVLKKDVESLLATLGDMAAGNKDAVVDAARSRARKLRSQAVDTADSAQETFDHLAEQARSTVKESPGTAMLIAAAIGMLFGILTARK